MASQLIPAGGTIGILGGGQLGRMMALAGRAMGLRTIVWEKEEVGPAQEAADGVVAASYDNDAALREFRSLIDVATYEFENVPFETAKKLEATCGVFPSPELLYMSQNRLREKDWARTLDLAVTPYRGIASPAEARAAADELGLPGIIKTVSGGYDGKGQLMAHTADAAAAAFNELYRGTPLIYEKKVAFVAEISVMVGRDQYGATAAYPVTENHHRHGILDWSAAPARISAGAADIAVSAATRVAVSLNLVGVMAVEFFVTANNEVIFNEMAPRPHNSGHWTIEGCWPSQFTQHMRAVAGWPLAEPRLFAPAVMMNLLGDQFMDGWQTLPKVLALPGLQLHWYGKKEMRPGRKVGHLTLMADSLDEALALAREAKRHLGGEWCDGASQS